MICQLHWRQITGCSGQFLDCKLEDFLNNCSSSWHSFSHFAVFRVLSSKIKGIFKEVEPERV